jgi:hypothetical protein
MGDVGICILWPFGIFMAVLYILWPFGICILWLFTTYFPVLECCAKTNLETLTGNILLDICIQLRSACFYAQITDIPNRIIIVSLFKHKYSFSFP